MMKKIPLLLLPLLFFIPQVQAATSGSFPDVPELHPNEDAFSYLKEEGVFEGYPDGTVKPENRIQRVELAKVMVENLFTEEEIAKCTDPGFPDVPAGQWFSNHVCMVKANGIMEGYPDGTFKLTDKVNFVEAAKIVAEANKISGTPETTDTDWFVKYVEALEEKKAIPSTIDFFDEDVTRGEIAEMEYRIEANVTDQVSDTYEEIKEVLPKISSCDALEEKMYIYHNRPFYGAGGGGMGAFFGNAVAMEEDSAEAAAPMEAQSGGGLDKAASDDYSGTNLQVDGVDEADIIKNDGKYIYMLKGDTVRIVEAFPPTDMKETSKIDFNQDGKETGFYPQELYVMEDRLVVIGNSNYYYAQPLMAEEGDDVTVDSKMIAPGYNKSQSMIYVYDISDHANPKEIRKASFDGNYQTSRRIGEEVYLVLNAHPNYWNWDKATSGETFLPMFTDGEKAEEPMVDCTGVNYFPGYSVPQYLITASVNLNDADAPIGRDVYLGSSENYYVSATDLFVATTVLDAESYTDWDWTEDEAQSNVFRFALKDGEVDFIARGSVPGRSLNQFSMDQHENHFRIATTTGNRWNWDGVNDSKNNVYILDAGMKQVGKLEGLAPGERIYSTRFLGDRLYMVTFEQVDPFFVIDLANPKAPKVLGELKLPGFSEYLHPYDENHIIGFGQDTKVNDDDNVEVGGFKMSLFDVTDPKNPIEKDQEIIGESGTYSELLYNHKALLFDKEKDLLAFPIQVQELVSPAEMQCNTFTKSTCPYDCIQACVSVDGQCADVAGSCVAPTYDQYETTFAGAIVYSITDEGFTEKGRITHLDKTANQQDEEYWQDYYNNSVQRIIYIGDYLYTIAQGNIKASNLSDVKEIDMVELAPNPEEEVGIMY